MLSCDQARGITPPTGDHKGQYRTNKEKRCGGRGRATTRARHPAPSPRSPLLYAESASPRPCIVGAGEDVDVGMGPLNPVWGTGIAARRALLVPAATTRTRGSFHFGATWYVPQEGRINLCSDIVSRFAQAPDDPQTDEPEYTQDPFDKQGYSESMAKGLWNGDC